MKVTSRQPGEISGHWRKGNSQPQAPGKLLGDKEALYGPKDGRVDGDACARMAFIGTYNIQLKDKEAAKTIKKINKAIWNIVTNNYSLIKYVLFYEQHKVKTKIYYKLIDFINVPLCFMLRI